MGGGERVEGKKERQLKRKWGGGWRVEWRQGLKGRPPFSVPWPGWIDDQIVSMGTDSKWQ